LPEESTIYYHNQKTILFYRLPSKTGMNLRVDLKQVSRNGMIYNGKTKRKNIMAAKLTLQGV